MSGSLTGAVAPKGVSEALKDSLRMVETIRRAKAEGESTRHRDGTGTKVGLSILVDVHKSGIAIAQRIKALPRDNRLITPKFASMEWFWQLCRLIASAGLLESQVGLFAH